MFQRLCLFYRTLQPSVLYSTNILIKENELMERLYSEFGNLTLIKSALKNNELNCIHFDEWKKRIDELKSYHFRDSHCLEMIVQCPNLLKIPLDEFKEGLQQWFYTDVGIHNFHKILLENPQFLEVDVEEIRERVPNLRAFFRSSTGFTELLIKSPNVMFDDWNSVLFKINYLIKERRFKMGEIMQSSALSYSLDYIKFRLELLEKCGVYKQDNTPVHKENRYDISKHKNPHLKSILVPNPKMFVKTAKISLEEYSVCRRLHEEQEEEDFDDDFENINSQ